VRRKSAVLFFGAAVGVLSACGRGQKTSVVLISVDTLRADHLPAYGYRAVETPAIDALARDSILFENAYCQVPLTLPSHAVILTGRPPYENGVRDNVGFRLAPSMPTLASLLKDAGYATGAAVSSLALRADRGLDSGFNSYDDRFSKQSPDERPGTESSAALLRFLDTAAGRPAFLFLHVYEPHTPYAPPEPFRTRYAASPYDGEIAAADAAVGGFVAELKRRGLYDRAIVVLLADHGEGLGDHGEDEHGVFLYREAIRVPLLVKLPGGRRAGERVTRPVGLVDVLPTVVSALGLPPPAGVRGASLLDGDAKGGASRRIYSETLYPRLALGWSELFSLADARFQYIEAPRPELYDLATDPGEHRDLSSGKPEAFRAMRAELQRLPRSEAVPENATAEEIAKLGSLGYISVNRGATGALPDPKDRIASLSKYKKLFELFYAKQDARVLPLAEEILAAEPAMISVWRMRAVSRERLGDLAGAAHDLESALARCPDAAAEQKSETIAELARLWTRAGEREKAERMLREAVAGPLATDAMRLSLATLLTESGRAEEAARILPPESPSEDAAVADARGVAAAESGRLDEARRHFLAALAREPGNATAMLHMGMLSLREKDPAGARSWFEKSLASLPDAPGTLSALGVAQAQLGDTDGARASWTRALALDPSQYDTLFNLALLAGKTGRTEEARRALKRFLETAPADRYAGQRSEAKRLLQSLPEGPG
jgi:choline-sulfatase